MSAVKRVGWVALSVVAVAGLGLTAAAANGFGFAPTADAPERRLPATDTITKQNLVASTEESGKVANVAERTLRGAGGIVTWLPNEGAGIERGAPLYRVDEAPTVLLYGSLPAYRSLDVGTSGGDVQQFEQNLAALGYTGFDVDEEYTAATAWAVEEWQKSLGLERTGIVEPSRVHYASGALRVIDRVASVGDAAGSGLVTVASQNRIVTVDLDETDARYATVGAPVTVTLPNGTELPGKISALETVVSGGQENPDGTGAENTTKLRVTVAPDDPEALPTAGASTAKVSFTADSREDVLTVPVSALLALTEGGYGVEIVKGKKSKLVGVETGLFADGRVEIEGKGISEGDKVVIPE